MIQMPSKVYTWDPSWHPRMRRLWTGGVSRSLVKDLHPGGETVTPWEFIKINLLDPCRNHSSLAIPVYIIPTVPGAPPYFENPFSIPECWICFHFPYAGNSFIMQSCRPAEFH